MRPWPTQRRAKNTIRGVIDSLFTSHADKLISLPVLVISGPASLFLKNPTKFNALLAGFVK